MNEKEKESIATALKEIARDGRVPCKAALALADRLGVSPGEVGRTANELKIKIAACQLGCF